MNLQSTLDLASAQQVKTTRKNTVCMDLDDTLFAFEPAFLVNRQVGDPNPEAVKLAKRFFAMGYQVVVLTARPDLEPAIEALKRVGLGRCVVTNVKPPALCYVDDRALPWKPTSTATDIITQFKALLAEENGTV